MKMTNEERQALIERIAEICAEYSKPNHSKAFSVKDAEIAELARIALAALTAEPVAWRHDDGPFAKMAMTRSANVAQSWINNGWKVTPLVESSIDNTAQQYESLAKEDKC